jgi:hypothetical protein
LGQKVVFVSPKKEKFKMNIPPQELLSHAAEWVTKNNADMFIFNGDIEGVRIDQLMLLIRAIPKELRKETLALVLVTKGGDPDAGYRLARFIKRTYKKFIVYVFGYCKSAGSLITLAADEIVMGDFGELGPLDIQLSKEDDFLHNISGLSYNEALIMLRETAFEMFERQFLEIQAKSGGNITPKTAAEIASRLATDLLTPIASQIEPVKLGEVGRAINISTQYGSRLLPLNPTAVQALASEYPSHSFVIDCEEAGRILAGKVRAPTEDESLIEQLLFNVVRYEQRTETQSHIIDRLTERAFAPPRKAGDGVSPSNEGEDEQSDPGDSQLHQEDIRTRSVHSFSDPSTVSTNGQSVEAE